jgi:hypothetical protein
MLFLNRKNKEEKEKVNVESIKTIAKEEDREIVIEYKSIYSPNLKAIRVHINENIVKRIKTFIRFFKKKDIYKVIGNEDKITFLYLGKYLIIFKVVFEENIRVIKGYIFRKIKDSGNLAKYVDYNVKKGVPYELVSPEITKRTFYILTNDKPVFFELKDLVILNAKQMRGFLRTLNRIIRQI